MPLLVPIPAKMLALSAAQKRLVVCRVASPPRHVGESAVGRRARTGCRSLLPGWISVEYDDENEYWQDRKEMLGPELWCVYICVA